MKLLSAKNKKYAMIAGAIIGALFIFSSIYGSIKEGIKDPKEILIALWEDLKSLVSFNSVVVLLSFAALSLTPLDGVTMALTIGTLTTGAAVLSTFNTTYLPEFVHYVAATQLTGLKITVQGEGVVFDSDANGLTHCGVNRLLGQVTNQYTFRLSNGLIKNKNVIWDFTNSAAQTPVVYVDNHETAPDMNKLYLKLERSAILANSGQDFRDFATLSLPSLSATDIVTVTYRDGTVQQMNRADILERLQWTQNIVNTPVYCIDNFGGTIANVNVLAGIAQTAYLQLWRSRIS